MPYIGPYADGTSHTHMGKCDVLYAYGRPMHACLDCMPNGIAGMHVPI